MATAGRDDVSMDEETPNTIPSSSADDEGIYASDMIADGLDDICASGDC
jgi:hypothetical protein